jgi:hypothetical protein
MTNQPIDVMKVCDLMEKTPSEGLPPVTMTHFGPDQWQNISNASKEVVGQR